MLEKWVVHLTMGCMYVHEENLDACDARAESGTQCELRWGKGKRDYQCWETRSSGIYKECHFVHPSVRSK